MDEIEGPDDLVQLVQCDDLPEAELLRSLLDSEGIFVNLSGAHHRAVMSFAGPDIRVGLWVRRGDLARAEQLLASREENALALPKPTGGSPEDAPWSLPAEDGEEPPPSTDAEIEQRARRRRRRRKLAAWVLLGGPTVALLVPLLVLRLWEALRLDWKTLRTSAVEARFPTEPSHLETAARGHRVERYEAEPLRSGCAFLLQVDDIPGLDRVHATALIDRSVEGLEQGVGASFAHGVDLNVHGQSARRISTSGKLDGKDVVLRAQWMASPHDVSVQWVVCPEGSFDGSDADAFLGSVRVHDAF